MPADAAVPADRSPATGPADLVVTGARVRLAAGRYAEAVAVHGDRITAVGSRDEVLAQAGPRTERVDVPGGLVLPGFQDAHVHAPFGGRDLIRVWLHDLSGRQAYLDAIAAYAAAHPDEPWITGGGWAMEYFPGGNPRREDLDAVVPDRPVFLYNRDVHGAWVNSRALELAGIDRHTPDPADGRIERDPRTGEPTGMLHEGAAYTFNDTHLPLPGRTEWEAAVLAGQAHLHRLGITGWQDAWVTPGTQEAYQALYADGRLTARVVGALWWERHQGLEQVQELVARREAGLRAGREAREARQSGGGRSGGGGGAREEALSAGFFPTSVKIMLDGVLENYTGALLEPYCDGCGGHTDNSGLTYVEPELLAAAVTELDRHGFQVHQHAIGDRAVRLGLDAVAAARAANGPRGAGADARHHIARIQVVNPADLPRFAQLGVLANCQAYWAQHEPQMEELTLPFLGPERAEQQYPFAALLASGARLAMGSDWAVSTADPLEQIEVAATRTDPARRGTQPFLPGQRISLDAAVDAFTAGSAHVNHDADGGVLAVGRRADLAVLDRDFFAAADAGAAAAGSPADSSVVLTVASGRVVYRA